jgi:hypothetical protein
MKIYAFYELQAYAFSIVKEELVARHSFSISFIVLTVKNLPIVLLIKRQKSVRFKDPKKQVYI